MREGRDNNDTTFSLTQFDNNALQREYRVNNGKSGKVQSKKLKSATEIKIVSRINNRAFSKLPLLSSETKQKRESKVVELICVAGVPRRHQQ